MASKPIFAVIIALLLPYGEKAVAKGIPAPVRVHSDLPYLKKNGKLLLDLFYSSDTTRDVRAFVSVYKFITPDDSVLVLKKNNLPANLEQGSNKIKLDFSKDDTDTYYSPEFYQVLKRAHNIAPGSYSIHMRLTDSSFEHETVYFREIDSNLSSRSPMRKDINSSLKGKRSFIKKSKYTKSIQSGIALNRSKLKIRKAVRKQGLTPHEYETDNQFIVDLYYRDWFAGRYVLEKKKPLSEQIRKHERLAAMPTNVNVPGGSGPGQPTLFSQYKSHNKGKREQEEMKGSIGLTMNMSSGQEQYSAVNNNYYEIRGLVELPIMGLPVELQGLYTSQDNNRKIKSSFFRVHYDVDKIKGALRESINSYNRKYAERKSRGVGMKQIYGTAINNLENQKSRLERASNIEAPEINSGGSSDRQKKIATLDKKISRYRRLLAQAENADYFDSSVVYNKTSKVNRLGDLSSKQLAKNGAELFPDGKAKSAICGITSFDAGMFPKNESKYTMGGQMLKGVDAGYDIGFCEVEGTVGKTEYVGRDGTLDRYTCYSGRAIFKPHADQKISLIYYGYAPDAKSLSKDAFFSKLNISAPGFLNPVHILSANYTGTMTEYVTIESEVASSIRQTGKEDIVSAATQNDKLAYHLNIDGTIPNSTISLQGTYDKTGKSFENSTLPISMSGTSHYRLVGRSDFFKSFLTAGIEYNLMKQSNFYSEGTNSKWGFDIKTNTKRYPSISLSYKPFTSFRSYVDTLSIPQKPLLGSVWTGKASYSLKRQNKSWRFLVLYNETRTVFDTSNYSSKLIQASCFYGGKKVTNVASVGRTEMGGATLVSVLPTSTTFFSLGSTYTLSNGLAISFGQEIGFANFGLCRYSPNSGLQYRFRKLPFTTRLSIRYNTYKMNEVSGWKQLFGGNIDVLYRFKSKMGKRAN